MSADTGKTNFCPFCEGYARNSEQLQKLNVELREKAEFLEKTNQELRTKLAKAERKRDRYRERAIGRRKAMMDLRRGMENRDRQQRKLIEDICAVLIARGEPGRAEMVASAAGLPGVFLSKVGG